KVMHYRLARATAQPSGSGRTRKAPRLIVGLIPHATGPMTSEMRQALTERRELIEARADAILDTALHGADPWTTALGETPADERGAARWRRDARTIAAYRDRYQVDDDAPLGPAPQTATQKIDRARARAAFDRAQKLTQAEQPEQERARRSGSQRLGPTL
ncbi:MAG: hypothetical protein L0H59_02680, partial [Tomitella sp.]|nr:hypothetical protein [Tomitella sp.]